MAGLGRRTFAAGEVLTASNVMGYLQDQAVMNFAGTAARGSAIGTAVSEGMVSYLADSNTVQAYDGSAWNSLAYASSVFTPGLIPVIPPTVSISGGTATANTLGKISFTNATSIKLNGVFSATYETYKIVINLTSAAAAAGAIIARLGTTNTGYQYQIFRGYTSTTAASSTASAGEWWISQQGSGAQSLTEVTLANPFTASVSKIISQSGAYNGADFTVINSFGQLVNNTSYTDFYFAPSSSNITGSIQIYGYNS